ncbi:TraM recognition domain-containing protein [Microbacterium sp.]|uniref:type IV secretory system conjugative DNA transfer family protein n=1 Tax=Microbacterium sp. TaxID=51671 RepID=UPI0025DF2A6A|nr:TraM recognition domain-containing protein [Microbacterium sp.]MBT9605910.1 TraM recognition domain-containing protein [Microbacterium sp.]
MTTTPPTTTDLSGLVFSRLLLPTPLDTHNVEQFLRRIASDQVTHRLVLETIATKTGIMHLIGTAATRVHQTRRLLGDLIPGVIMTGTGGATRPTLSSAGHVIARPAGVPLDHHAITQVARALYSGLSHRLHDGEAIVLQVVLGHGIHPSQTPTKLTDPRPLGLWQALTTGTAHAPTELRTRIRDRQADYGLQATIRIGVTGTDPARRRRFALELISALSLMEAPGVDLSLKRDTPERVASAQLRRPLRLSVPELAGLLGWPIGPDPLPGMPPSHPKLLRLDPGASSSERVFARSLVPGDERLVGITAKDSGMHDITVGPSGSGKSNVSETLILADITAGCPVVVIDPKSEMPDQLRSRIPKERWKDIREIDGSAVEPLGFDPFDATGRDPDLVADGILAVFSKIFADGWGPRTEDIFSASIRTLMRASTPESPNTLVDLPRLWTDDRYRRTQVAAVADDLTLAGFWAWYEALKPAQRLNVIAAPMNKLRKILLKPAAVKILGQRNPGFRLRDVFRDRLIVIVPTNPALIGEETAALISALVVADVWLAVQERVTDPKRDNVQGHVYIDEADRLMHLPVSLADALARSRSMNVSWHLNVQGWHQMPTAMQQAAKTNARTKLIFKSEDDEEAKIVARMAPELSHLDFMALGKYQAYLKPVVGGITKDWALVQTLPLGPPLHNPDEVLAASRAACPPGTSEPTAAPAPPASSISTPTAKNIDDAAAQPTEPTEVFGKKRRQP